MFGLFRQQVQAIVYFPDRRVHIREKVLCRRSLMPSRCIVLFSCCFDPVTSPQPISPSPDNGTAPTTQRPPGHYGTSTSRALPITDTAQQNFAGTTSEMHPFEGHTGISTAHRCWHDYIKELSILIFVQWQMGSP